MDGGKVVMAVGRHVQGFLWPRVPNSDQDSGDWRT